MAPAEAGLFVVFNVFVEGAVPMKTAIVGLMFVAAQGAPAAAHARPPEAPLAAVQRLFDAMRQRDTTTMRGLMDPSVRLVTTASRNGEPVIRHATADEWIGAVGRATVELDERTWDPRVEVDDNLATVWLKYEFVAGGQFSHCGVDAFQLFKSAAGWRIFQVADTQRRENCWHKPA